MRGARYGAKRGLQKSPIALKIDPLTCSRSGKEGDSDGGAAADAASNADRGRHATIHLRDLPVSVEEAVSILEAAEAQSDHPDGSQGMHLLRAAAAAAATGCSALPLTSRMLADANCRPNLGFHGAALAHTHAHAHTLGERWRGKACAGAQFVAGSSPRVKKGGGGRGGGGGGTTGPMDAYLPWPNMGDAGGGGGVGVGGGEGEEGCCWQFVHRAAESALGVPLAVDVVLQPDDPAFEKVCVCVCARARACAAANDPAFEPMCAPSLPPSPDTL